MIRLSDVVIGTKGQVAGPGHLPPDFLFRAVVIDSRQVVPESLFVALAGTTTDGHRFLPQAVARGAAAALVRADWLASVGGQAPLPVIVVPDTLAALHDLAAWWRSLFDVPLVGVTGSVGKTSTKELIATVLGTRYRVLKSPGNLNAITGMPLALLGLTPDVQVAVLEMGLYDPGDIATMVRVARPTVGVVTNIGMSHVERFGSQAALVHNKGDLIAGLPVDGVAVLNGDDENVRGMQTRTGARVLLYGLGPENAFRATDVESAGLSGIAFTLSLPGARPVHVKLPLLGRHSVHTALAATAVGSVFELALADILQALEGEQTQLRLFIAPGPNGATLIDDTYNSSPQSALAALNLLAELDTTRRVAVLGDMLELGVYESEGHTLVGRRAAAVVDCLYTFGPRARTIADAAVDAGISPRAVLHFGAEERDALAARLRADVREGDTVLIKGSRGMHMERIVDALRAPVPSASEAESTETASEMIEPGEGQE